MRTAQRAYSVKVFPTYLSDNDDKYINADMRTEVNKGSCCSHSGGYLEFYLLGYNAV
jgi:hypothetical protein